MATFVQAIQVLFKALGTGAASRDEQAKLRDIVSVKDFGAVGDGVADDTTAIQNAINASSHVFLPFGKYKITASLLIDDRHGMVIEGDGVRGSNNGGTLLGTLIQWAGNTTDPAIRVFGSAYTTLRGFKVLANTAFPLHTGIRFETKLSRVNTRNALQDVSINSDGILGSLHYAIRVVPGTGGDANNDQMQFDHLTIGGYDTVGVDFNMHQAVDNVFTALVMGSGLGTDSVGVKALEGANFTVIGGGGGAHLGSDFRTEGSYNPTVIQNWHSENSTHYLQVYFDASPLTPADLAHPVSIIGGSFNNIGTNFSGGNLHVVDFYEEGPLVIENFSVFGTRAVNAAIYHDATALSAYNLIINGLYMDTNLTNPFTKMQPTSITGFDAFNNAGTHSALERKLIASRVTLTYSASIATDAGMGNSFVVTATNATAFTMTNPTNLVAGQRVLYTFRNTSGGAMGAITFGSAGFFKMPAFTNPATANSRSVEFVYDGTNLVQLWQSAADVPN